MKLSNKQMLIAGLMATLGFAAVAQNAAPATPAAGHAGMQGMHQGDSAKMQERMQGHRQERAAKRLATLKAKLKITAAQEGAWTTFSTAMKPPANGMGGMGMRHDPAMHAEMEKLTTPERIDKMRTLRQQHMASMNAEIDKRADATKAFYGVLSSEQKAVFDAIGMQGDRHGRRGGEHGGWGGHHGGMGDHPGQGHGRMGQPG